MALTAIKGGFIWPERTWECPTNTSRLLDATGEKFAVLVTFTAAATLGKIRFRTGTVTTGDTVKVSYQDRDPATGDPDGTPDQYRTISIANGDDNVWLLTGLVTSDGTDTGSKRSVAAGDSIFVVFEFDSYVAGNLNLLDSSTPYVIHNNNYTDLQTGGTWAKNATWGCVEVMNDADVVQLCIGSIPAANSSSTAINNTSGVREQGNYFQVPVAMTVGGLFATVDVDGDVDAILYDSDGTTVLASASIDKDNRQGTGVQLWFAKFSADVTLAAATWYRMVLKPTSATNMTFRQMDSSALTSLDGMPGGQFCYWTEKSSGGSWSQTTTRVAKIWLWATSVHDGSGGGGLLVHPGMTGGMN